MFFYDEHDRGRFADPAERVALPQQQPTPRQRYEPRIAANREPKRAERRRLSRMWWAWIERRDAGEVPEPLPPFPRFTPRAE